MKQKKELTASEMGKKGYKTRLAKLGKEGFRQAMRDAVNKRYAKQKLDKKI